MSNANAISNVLGSFGGQLGLVNTGMNALRKIFTAFLLTFCAITTGAHAQSARNEKIDRLIDALGVAQMLNSSQDLSAQAAANQFDATIDELAKAGRPIHEVDDLRQFARDMAIRVAKSWDIKEASRIYISSIFENLSEEELDMAIAAYENQAFLKIHNTIIRAQQKTLNYINTAQTEQTRVEMQKFIQFIRQKNSR